MPTVVVIGAGIAGLATALFLQQHGTDVAVYETRSESYTSGGTITLAPNGLRVLAHLGLYSALRAKGFNHKSITLLSSSGQILTTTPPMGQDVYSYDALRITRSELINVLRREVSQRGIEINYGHRCSGVTGSESSVTVHFDGNSDIGATFVVAADGMHSSLRSHIAPGVSEKPIYAGQTQITGFASDDIDPKLSSSVPLPAIFLTPNGTFGIMPYDLDGTKLSYGVTLTMPEMTKDGQKTFATDQKALLKLIADEYISSNTGVHPLIEALINSSAPGSLQTWPYASAPWIETWYSASSHCRAFIIGDAAHALPPSGQGAGMALEDAESLSWTILEILAPNPNSSHEDVDERRERLAAAWDGFRRPRIKQVIALGLSAGSLRKQQTWYVHLAKEWLIWGIAGIIALLKNSAWLHAYNAESVRKVLI